MTSFDIAPRRAQSLDDALATPRATLAVFAVLVAIATAPVWIWPIPRGNDIVDHWARLTLYGMAADDPLSALYRVRFGLIPNLGLDALYLTLSPILSAQQVARLGLTLAIALPAFGAFALHRALFAKPSPTIWLAPYLSYNVATTGGLINYALGMGVALFGLAFAAQRERICKRDYLVLNLIGAALFFCHLIACAAFAGLLVLLRVETLRAAPALMARRAGEALLALAAPLALIAMRAAPPSTYELGGSKMAVLFAPIATMTGTDLAALAGLLAVVALIAARGADIAPMARLAVAGFALAAVCAPSAHGAANLIDARLTVFAVYVAIAATALRAPAGVRPCAAALALALVAARLAAVAPAWAEFQQRAEAARAGLKALPTGARALVVAPLGCGMRDFLMFENLTAFAVIDRRAYVNTLFAQSGMQPVAPRDPTLDGAPTLAMDPRWLTDAGRAQLPEHLREAPWAAAFRDWRRHFTHVIDAHGDCAATVEAAGLTRLGGAGGLDIYRID